MKELGTLTVERGTEGDPKRVLCPEIAVGIGGAAVSARPVYRITGCGN